MSAVAIEAREACIHPQRVIICNYNGTPRSNSSRYIQCCSIIYCMGAAICSSNYSKRHSRNARTRRDPRRGRKRDRVTIEPVPGVVEPSRVGRVGHVFGNAESTHLGNRNRSGPYRSGNVDRHGVVHGQRRGVRVRDATDVESRVRSVRDLGRTRERDRAREHPKRTGKSTCRAV